MIISSLCACFGQLMWKLSASQGFMSLFCGFCLYGIGALVMLVAYRFGKLSVLQPMLSLNYVISIILGFAVFREPVTFLKCLGVVVIISGVILIAGGDRE